MDRQRFLSSAALSSFGTAASIGSSPEPLYSVRHYGTSGNGSTLDTTPLQKAIEACGTAGSGAVYLPPGKYLTGTLRLTVGLNLCLDSGSVLTRSNFQTGLCRIVRALRRWMTIDGLRITWDQGLPAFFTSALRFENSNRIEIDHFYGRQPGPPSHGATI